MVTGIGNIPTDSRTNPSVVVSSDKRYNARHRSGPMPEAPLTAGPMDQR